MTTGEQTHECTRCGLTCDLADAPQHFFRKPTGKHGFDHRCKSCFAAYNRERYQARRNDPSFIEQKKRKNRESYQRRKDDWHYKEQKRQSALASYHRRKGSTVDRSNTNRPARPNESTREPVGVRPVVALDQALRDLEAALRLHIVEMNERDETLVKYLHVTRAIWARIAPESIAKGA